MWRVLSLCCSSILFNQLITTCGCWVPYIPHFISNHLFFMIYCCSVSQLCLTLCDPMDCSMPGFLVLHYFPEFAQTYVHWVGDGLQSSRPLSSPSLPAFLQSFPTSEPFPLTWLITLGGQSIGTSASALVLPMNVQGWFPLGLTGLISLQSHPYMTTGKNCSFDYMDLYRQSNVSVL